MPEQAQKKFVLGAHPVKPNRVLGYRIKADEHNWIIVRVKEHGEFSKYNGEEYLEEMQYHQKLSSAVSKVFDYNARFHLDALQQEGEPTLAQLEIAIAQAENSTLKAIADLRADVLKRGVVPQGEKGLA